MSPESAPRTKQGKSGTAITALETPDSDNRSHHSGIDRIGVFLDDPVAGVPDPAQSATIGSAPECSRRHLKAGVSLPPGPHRPWRWALASAIGARIGLWRSSSQRRCDPELAVAQDRGVELAASVSEGPGSAVDHAGEVRRPADPQP